MTERQIRKLRGLIVDYAHALIKSDDDEENRRLATGVKRSMDRVLHYAEVIEHRATMKQAVELRTALADYMASEGCSCCQSEPEHAEAMARLAKLLHVPMYDDKSGYNFSLYETKKS